MKLRTMTTSVLPLLTPSCCKIRTMPGKSPAVMQRPFHPHRRMALNPVEQQFYIEIISMNIMQPHKIRLIALCPLEKPACCTFRAKAMLIKKSGSNQMKCKIFPVPDPDGNLPILLRHLLHPTISNTNLITALPELVRKLCTNSSRTTNSTNTIDN